MLWAEPSWAGSRRAGWRSGKRQSPRPYVPPKTGIAYTGLWTKPTSSSFLSPSTSISCPLPSSRRSSSSPTEGKVAVVQCGFPETHQTRPAVDIMRQFARETGFQWAGALALGMGGAVGGRPLDKAGGMLRRVVQAIDLTAASLLSGGGAPEEATALMARPLMPRRLYHLAANWGFRRQIKRHGARTRVYDRPYA